MNKSFERELTNLTAGNGPRLTAGEERRICAAALQKIRALQAAEGPSGARTPHKSAGRSGNTIRLARRTGRSLRRTVALAAVAACLAFATLAVSAAGILGQAGFAAPGFWQTLFPGSSALEASQAQSALQENLMYSGASIAVDGCTFTVLNYVTDENGNGCIYYSVENPDGMAGVFEQYRPAGPDRTYSGILNVELGGGTHAARLALADGTQLTGREYLDEANSTDTCWYVFGYFSAADPAAAMEQELLFTVSAHAEAEEAPLQETILRLPAVAPLPAVWAADPAGGVTVRLSAVGLTVEAETEDFIDVNQYLAVEFADGSRYVLNDTVGGQGQEFGYCCGTAELNDVSYVFRQVIDPAGVQAVYVDGLEIPLK